MPILPFSNAPSKSEPSRGLRACTVRNFGHESGRADVSDRCFVFSTALGQSNTGPFQLMWDAYHVFTGAGESTSPAFTLEASISIYNGAWLTPRRVTFNSGQLSATMPVKGVLLSDPIEFGMLKESISGSLTLRICVVTRVQMTLGQNMPIGSNASGGAGIEGDATLLTLPGGGTGVSSGATTGQYTIGSTYGPSGIFYIDRDLMSSGVALFGDSIMAGTGETSGAGSPHGFAVRRLSNAGIGYYYAPRSGQRVADWVSTYSFRMQRLAATQYYPVTIFEYIVNDVDSERTFSQIKADLLLAWSELAQSGTRVYQCTCVPKTTSSDQYATAQNQTIAFNAGEQQVRGDVNDWLRSGQAAKDSQGNLKGIVDIAAPIEVDENNVLTENGGRWLTNGTINFYTADGLHPSTNGHTLIGNQAITDALIKQWKKGYKY